MFPSALENAITAENAPRMKPKISCELANGPTTPEGDSILCAQNTFVIPDFLANAGGVTVSYFEQVQNGANFYWSIEEVHERLDAKMTKAFNDVYEAHKKYEVPMRIAAYIVAVRRVAQGDGAARMGLSSEARAVAQDLLDYVEAAPSPFHAVAETSRRLEAAGFSRLSEADAWDLVSRRTPFRRAQRFLDRCLHRRERRPRSSAGFKHRRCSHR